jgi:protein translocase SecG subunit
MALLIGFLTFILVVNCLFLMLLVLVQLPKKEAGAGLAFGAGAVDTLIGAGSGNALTKLTKYAAGSFLGMAVVLAVLNGQRHQAGSRSLQEQLSKRSSASLPVSTPATKAPVTTPAAPATTPGDNAAAATTAAGSGAPTIQLNPTPAAAPQVTPAAPATTQQAPAAAPQQPAPAK